MRSEPVLVSGGTGYVGGRLVPLLLDSGYRVRVLGRSLAKLGARPWAGHENIEMAQGDFLDYASLEKAAQGCWAAFYLVHSITFLRVAMILGSGSAFFEMMRYLTERLPVMITPSWVRNQVQPIAIRNVLGYMKCCLEHDETMGGTFDIGGPDILTYRQLMETYAGGTVLESGYRLLLPVYPLSLPSVRFQRDAEGYRPVRGKTNFG